MPSVQKGYIVMGRNIEKSLIPMINVMLALILGSLVTNVSWAFTMQFMTAFFLFALMINIVSCVYLLETSAWSNYFICIGIFLVMVVIYAAINITISKPGPDEGNIADGLIMIVTFFLSFFALTVGSFIGLLIRKHLKKS